MKNTARLTTLIELSLVLILTACGSQDTGIPAEVPTEPPTLELEPTTEPAVPDEPGDMSDTTTTGIVAYQIIPEESKASYEVGETFINQNNRFNLAIGITQEVSGTVTVDWVAPQNSTVSTITIDISTLTSDSGMRDNRIRGQWLESSKYPIATFEPTSIEGLPTTYTEGEEITFRVTGNLTVREITNPVTFDVTAIIEGDTLRGSASGVILLSDYGISITIAGTLSVEDEMLLRFDFVAREG